MRPKPYADAPRLPEGEPIRPDVLLAAAAASVELEIGPGRGWFMIERLAAAPALGMVGLEIRRKWAAIVDERLRRRGFGDRARVFAEDARVALPRLASASFSVVYVHFPDPWWKKRHRKRLLVTDDLLHEVARVLRPGGELFVQTDVSERVEAYAHLVRGVPALQPWGDRPEVEENPYRARSPRERRTLQDGLPVYRLRYRRSAA
jgi:tRNA (guanine-N7-)-methyltransferase